MRFRTFLINEEKGSFAQRVADILSAVQDLNDNAENMGTRHLVSNAQTIADQIRRIIHTHWPEKEESNLEVLKKCGVAIMKTMDEKGDLLSILKSCEKHLGKISGEQEEPVNDLGNEEEGQEEEDQEEKE
jgi:hypothetical protein